MQAAERLVYSGHMERLIPEAYELANRDSVDTYFYLIEDRWERKLWHQLTEVLQDMYMDEQMRQLYIPVFERIVMPLGRQLNTLQVAFFAVAASHLIEDTQEAVDFMKRATGHITIEKDPQAFVLSQMRQSVLLLKLHEVGQVKKNIDRCRKTVEDDSEIKDQYVLSHYYRLCAAYAKLQGDNKGFYTNILNYLSTYKQLRQLPLEEVLSQCEAACIAGLLSHEVFDFSQLIEHEAFKYLAYPDMMWLVDAVKYVHYGEVQKFQRIKQTVLQRAPYLKDAMPFIEQKMCLAALMECVFKRQATERTLPFSIIARETHLQPGAKVEILLMKAFSIGLLEGTIDEVSKTVNITWIKPRKLSHRQLVTMRERVAQWDSDVRKLGRFVSSRGEDVWQAA